MQAYSKRLDLCGVLRRPPRIYPRCCLRAPAEIVRDPDPSTYTQRLALTAGSFPTFNSPDIDSVFLWPVRPIDAIKVRLRNLSADASANQTRVDLAWSAWGIGMQRQSIGSYFVDLARAGFPAGERQIEVPLPPALNAAGRYGVFAEIAHPYDRDLTNNGGEQSVDGFATSTGRSRTFPIPVRNPSTFVQTISLQVGPPSIVPWVVLVPATLTLGGGAQTNVMAQVNVPSGIPPSPPGTLVSATVDILALLGGSYLGGVSILILFDS